MCMQAITSKGMAPSLEKGKYVEVVKERKRRSDSNHCAGESKEVETRNLCRIVGLPSDQYSSSQWSYTGFRGRSSSSSRASSSAQLAVLWAKRRCFRVNVCWNPLLADIDYRGGHNKPLQSHRTYHGSSHSIQASGPSVGPVSSAHCPGFHLD